MTLAWRRFDTARSFFVPASGEPGLSLHVRTRGDDPARPPVLFVHGATYASRLYDIPHPGASWLEAAAAAGFAAYALDVRGYGLSRSAAMETSEIPYARAADVVHDIDDVARTIAERHGVDRIHLVGGSWGSVTAGLYASTIGNSRVGRLVLHAPIYAAPNEGWHRFLADPSDPARLNPAFGACRLVDEPSTRKRWDAELPAGEISRFRDEAVLQALVNASLADDPLAARHTPPAFRAPNGTLLDLWSCFNGIPIYDAAAITCPVLLVRGTLDPTSTRADAFALFDQLGSFDRRYVEIANSAHFLSAERRAPHLFATVNAFLAEGREHRARG